MDIKEIQEMKAKIDKGKTRLAELQGQKSQAMKQLKENHGVDSVAAAEKLLTNYNKELEKMEQEIEDMKTTLKEEFPQLFE